MMAAGLEHIEESDEVALEVGARVLDGVADARLGGEVHHDIEAVLGEQALDEAASHRSPRMKVKRPSASASASMRRRASLDAGVV